MITDCHLLTAALAAPWTTGGTLPMKLISIWKPGVSLAMLVTARSPTILPLAGPLGGGERMTEKSAGFGARSGASALIGTRICFVVSLPLKVSEPATAVKSLPAAAPPFCVRKKTVTGLAPGSLSRDTLKTAFCPRMP